MPIGVSAYLRDCAGSLDVRRFEEIPEHGDNGTVYDSWHDVDSNTWVGA